MKAKRQRELREDEIAARKRYGGMTRRQYNASKRPAYTPKSRTGSFVVRAIFRGNPKPQEIPFPNESAAVARFERLSTNENALSVSVIETRLDSRGNKRQSVIYSLLRLGQEFANSKVETLYRSSDSVVGLKAIKASPKLLEAYCNGNLEVHSYLAYGGEAWWERRA